MDNMMLQQYINMCKEPLHENSMEAILTLIEVAAGKKKKKNKLKKELKNGNKEGDKKNDASKEAGQEAYGKKKKKKALDCA
jgi:hypothetical protein